MHVTRLPADDPRCGWYAMLPQPGPTRRLEGAQQADWVVLGAGFTGLAAARQLARHHPDARVVLVEAERVGLGASGRNSGFVLDSPHYDDTADVEENRRMVRLNRAGLQLLHELVVEHDIACDWRAVGHFQVAVGARGLAPLEHYCRVMDGVEEPYERMDGEELADRIGTRHYRAAVHVPGTALMQPAALVRGLAAALPAGVELFEESPVQRLEVGSPIRLETPSGSVTAPRLLLATNAFTPALGHLRSRVFPLLTFSSLTRPLSEEARSRLGAEADWGVLAAEPMGTTFRRTVDHRILVRNSVRYAWTPVISAGVKRHMRMLHARSFRARFPQLGEPDFEYTWGGMLCMSLNAGAYFGALGSGVYGALCYNGAGASRGTIAGTLLADLAVGADSPLLQDAQQCRGPSWLPPDPVLGLGVGATTMYRQWRGRGER